MHGQQNVKIASYVRTEMCSRLTETPTDHLQSTGQASST